MNIVVCLKQVPDTTVVKIDPKTGTLIRDGVPSIINPEDKHALEAALQLKDNHGAHVTVVSMGPPQAKNALREALCMGADEAILLTDRAFGGADTLATSKTIAAAIKKLDYDIIFGGRQAIDGDTAQVGPEIAEHLGIPQVTYVQDVKIEEDGVLVNRALEDVASKDTGEVPMHIRNAPAKGMESLGYHQGYLYPHDFPGHYVEQQYLPDKMVGTKYYIKDENCE